MNEYMDEPKKSGTALKVVLIVITVIAVVAAVAMGLLFYNAKSSVESYRTRNEALSQEYAKAKEQIEQFDAERDDYEQQIADLTQQLQDAQEQLTMMEPPISGEEGEGEGGQQAGGIIDLSKNTDLSVKPDELYEKGVDYTVSVKGLNIRSGPGTTYKQLASVNQNSTVTAYADQDGWLLVSYKDNAYGWVKESFVSKK